MDVIEIERPAVSKGIRCMADECSRCREELARLTEENVALRRAAMAFGSLAERLNVSLQEERRGKGRHTTSHEGPEALNLTVRIHP
jgi:hypothetical protein